MSVTNFNNFSAEDILQALKKVDRELRPVVIYVNPKDEQALTKALGDLTERVLIKSCNFIEAGNAYAFDREYLEKWTNPPFLNLEEV